MSDADDEGPRDRQPLNLARIVFRLMTSPRGWAKDDLLAELGIAERTYRKYRKNLQDLFDPWFHEGQTRLEEVDFGERRYLRLREPSAPNGEVESLVLRLAAFHFAGELLGFLGEGELGQTLHEHTQTFAREGRRTFPMAFTRVLAHLDRLFLHLPDAPKSYAGQEAKLRVLLRCLVFCHRVRFRYDAANGEQAVREVEPLTLVHFRGGLHLLARFPGRTKPYNFAVDRIHEPEALADYYVYPDPDEYSPRELLQGAFGIFLPRDPSEPLTVELRFADVKWLKYYVREREWQRGQRLEDLPDGRLALRFEVTSLVEVTPWVLQFGADVEVVGPPELQRAVAEAHARRPGGAGEG